MHVEVFVDGTSLVNGQTLPEVKESAPRPARYEQWTRINITGVSSSRLAPPWVVVATLGSLAALVVALVGLRSGLVAATLVVVGGFGLLVLFLRLWFIVTARVNLYLVSRQDLGDWIRLLILGLAFVVVPVVAAGLLVGVVLLARMP